MGATLDELAKRHYVAEKTIRNWLDRFADKPLHDVPCGDERSGRPSKLSPGEKKAFLADLDRSLSKLGYEYERWFPALAHHHLLEEFGVEYSRRHVYRLFDEAGLTYRTVRPRLYKADPEEEGEFRDTVQKLSLWM